MYILITQKDPNELLNAHLVLLHIKQVYQLHSLNYALK